MSESATGRGLWEKPLNPPKTPDTDGGLHRQKLFDPQSKQQDASSHPHHAPHHTCLQCEQKQPGRQPSLPMMGMRVSPPEFEQAPPRREHVNQCDVAASQGYYNALQKLGEGEELSVTMGVAMAKKASMAAEDKVYEDYNGRRGRSSREWKALSWKSEHGFPQV
ncbi:hypothetical protein BD309DRAFT_865320 [Dichomitus squalens]|uniref:Uncharacterized protein n=1 Tax=Dichomitus squalens TaxID=114155 RepID=A0A4Q9PJ73_9APHY|nr:hypothetical protein BD309DRAFT_865320 [Dichomitus squalens]TBU54131.1 hypothetical protein BD310DRAFT_828643 [Dichomitus squalens]